MKEETKQQNHESITLGGEFIAKHAKTGYNIFGQHHLQVSNIFGMLLMRIASLEKRIEQLENKNTFDQHLPF